MKNVGNLTKWISRLTIIAFALVEFVKVVVEQIAN